MIGKITIGKSFKGCIAYCLNDKLKQASGEEIMKDRAEILLFNQCYGNQQDLIQQFNEVRQLNPKLSKPVLHITLSLAPGEHLSREKLMEMCRNCATDMGFENNQYVAIQHKDTKHPHLHIVANRIGFDKTTVRDSKNFQRIAAFCRKMELKYDLKQVLSPRQFLSKEQQQIPRNNARKEQLKSDIQKSLQQAAGYRQFEKKMELLGYQVLRGRGISFIDDKKVKIKGSEVGFSLMKIEKILALKQSNRKLTQPLNVPDAGQQNQQEKSWKKPDYLLQKDLAKNETQSVLTVLKKDATELLNHIIQAERMPEQLNAELLKKRKKKHRQRPHH